jgi:GNAT superfamily N-acetyltransferase
VTLTTFRDVPWNMPFYERLGFREIPHDQLSARLRGVVHDETRRGLDPVRRVVMARPCRPDAAAIQVDRGTDEHQCVRAPVPGVVVRDAADVEDLRFLEEQVNEYNFATTGIRDARLLVIFLREADGRMYAGLSGHTWGGVAEVRFLWVDESRRHRGIGSRLLRAAEDEARARGCTKIVLSTHTFQAPDFYRKHRYVIAGTFAEYPRGHGSIFLEKDLRD